MTYQVGDLLQHGLLAALAVGLVWLAARWRWRKGPGDADSGLD